jgi:phosphoribosylaminoimidazole-succinocarboxamide synthase
VTSPVLLETHLPNLYARGKVRDTYDLGDRLLMVATDRISAFDVVLPNGIPDKGAVLTQLSAFWFERTASVVPNHFIRLAEGAPADGLPFELPPEFIGRSMIVRKARRVDIECVVRGYLSGSGWAEYRESQSVCGIRLPRGLRESDELPEPIFTPSTKAESGHDINISEAEAGDIVGKARIAELRDLSIAVYNRGVRHAEGRGIIIADTKFEFGVAEVPGKGEQLILIDEVLTPDSSRFWPAAQYQPGGGQPSFDKQFVRDYLEQIGWNKHPPAPALPADVVARTREKYVEAFRQLTGLTLA